MEIQCWHCSRPFTPKRKDAHYCSGGCKQAAYRRRLAGPPTEPQCEDPGQVQLWGEEELSARLAYLSDFLLRSGNRSMVLELGKLDGAALEQRVSALEVDYGVL